ncbi:hypothetical protein ACJKIH_24560 (plasmid) [Brucella pseudogrignonensis]|uniref:hypothetical protein n=1 Tax=Brucella pseudogrignonensis TaxID=419475 RepID=UPI0038B4CE1B
MSSVKDPFSILADEITLLRNDIKNLQRTSLNKDEAQKLNTIVAKSLETMQTTAQGWDSRVQRQLSLTKAEIIDHATKGASTAATDAIKANQAEIMQAARMYAKNAGEARREAWRYFGGFWVWLTTIGLFGAILGGLGMFWLKGREAAEAFGQHPSVYCSSAGGIKGKFENGKSYCLFQLD